MNTTKILYWIGTILACGVFAFSATMYLTNTEAIQSAYQSLGFPAWLVIPMAIVKILGIVAVISRLNTFLMEWAYAGFFFDGVLAFSAHYHANDGQFLFSVIAIIGVILSRIMLSKAFPEKKYYSVI
ncbi:MAG: DoxX family protein [Bacteroidota bacterium]